MIAALRIEAHDEHGDTDVSEDQASLRQAVAVLVTQLDLAPGFALSTSSIGMPGGARTTWRRRAVGLGELANREPMP